MAGKTKKEVAFARPVFAKELMIDENHKKFDELPAWQRHLIKRIIDHGDLERAASEAGVSTFVSKNVDAKLADIKSIKESMTEKGITAELVAAQLLDCLEANAVRFDRNGNPMHFVDYALKLRTIELIAKLRGELGLASKSAPSAGAIDMFEDTDV